MAAALTAPANRLEQRTTIGFAYSEMPRSCEQAYGLAIDVSRFPLSDGGNIKHRARLVAARATQRDFAPSGVGGLRLFPRCPYPDSNADHFVHFHSGLGHERLYSV